MEFREVLRRRRMVRSFSDRPVSPETIEQILRAGLRAPSAGFTQGWAFLVLDGPDDTKRFWDTTFPDGRDGFQWPGLFSAPLIIVPLACMDEYLDRYAEPDKGWADRDPARWPVPYWYIDTGFAALLILLGTVESELGALFFGITRIPEFRAAFGVPDSHTPIGGIAIGYPAPDTPSGSLRRGWRSLDDVVHRHEW